MNGSILTDKINISNGINNYFSTIGEKLDQELRRKNNNLNPFDFKTYCYVPTKNSIFVTPTDSTELRNIIIKPPKFARVHVGDVKWKKRIGNGNWG